VLISKIWYKIILWSLSILELVYGSYSSTINHLLTIFLVVLMSILFQINNEKRCLKYELTMFRYTLEQAVPLPSHQKNRLPPNVKTSRISISVVEGTFILMKSTSKHFEKRNVHRHGYLHLWAFCFSQHIC